MASLKDILYGVSLRSINGEREIQITGIAFDSRKVVNGSLFVAIKGLTVDGHKYITQAIESGAKAIVAEILPENRQESITYIETENSSKALGILSSNFYGRPSEKLKLVGVTGTNGKTTTVTILYELFQRLGHKTGLISTVENRVGDQVVAAQYTTPDALQLNEMLSQMVAAGCSVVFMEVSSHALVQNRVHGVIFHGAIFTNMSHDHLDYHGTMDEYIRAKKILFDELKSEAFALVNTDDKRGQVMLQNCVASKHTYAIKRLAEFKCKILHNTLQGLELDMDGSSVWFRLIGKFNAYNLLAAYATGILLEESKEEVLTQLSQVNGAKGRFDNVHNTQQIIALVDYAHTPDALENVLGTINDLRTKNEKVITVVGCGGDRDRQKRPKMAAIASKFSDKVILTSDNPRTEDPEKILDDMYEGVPKSQTRKTMRITNRKEAILTACNLAERGDIILVAGKGHENYQEINGVRHPFDDREVLTEILTEN